VTIDLSPDWRSPGICILLVSLLLLALAWGLLERRVKLLAQGRYDPALGWEKSNLYVRVAQGVVSLALFALIGVCFWLFGWKVGLVALVLSFAIGAAMS